MDFLEERPQFARHPLVTRGSDCYSYMSVLADAGPSSPADCHGSSLESRRAVIRCGSFVNDCFVVFMSQFTNEGQSDTLVPASPLAPPERPVNARILLAEDEPHLRQLVTRILTRAGYAVAAYGDGAAALEVVEEDPASFQLLVTDIVMPHMNGFELAEAMRQHSPHTGVVMMTGYIPDDFVCPDALGDVVILSKPFTPEALVSAVARALTPA